MIKSIRGIRFLLLFSMLVGLGSGLPTFSVEAQTLADSSTEINRPQAIRVPAEPAVISPATANELAAAMGVPSAAVNFADLMGSDSDAVGVGDEPLGAWFPTAGDTFAILSTGLAMDADLPNNEEDLSWELEGLNNDQDNDLVRLRLNLSVPDNVNCMSFDFAFYSEEFPEYVGSEFNDTFTAQLNDSSLSTGVSEVLAPGNFAFDELGDNISINAAFEISPLTDTTYDGATPYLRATTPVTPGSEIDLYFSIQDLSDSVYDSAVFMDNFQWIQGTECPVTGVQEFTYIFLPVTIR